MNFRVGQFLWFLDKKKMARITNISKGFISLRYYTFGKAKEGFSGGMPSPRLISLFNKKEFVFIPPQNIMAILLNNTYKESKLVEYAYLCNECCNILEMPCFINGKCPECGSKSKEILYIKKGDEKNG